MGLTFFVKTTPGERVETHISLPEPTDCLLFGTLTDSSGAPAVRLPLLLLRDGEEFPTAQCVTDEQGRFCFGPLESEQLYQVCVFRPGGRIRRLDIQL